MKLVSWNVNGLRACVDKGFGNVFSQMDADVFCIQETKLQQGQIDLSFDGYADYWNYADKKGYSGTAVFTRIRPREVRYGMGVDDHDHEGRVIALDLGEIWLVNVYVPNSQEGLKRLDYRMRWEDDFLSYITRLDKEKPVVVCGDLNVAHEEIDLKNPTANRNNAGFTPQERAKMSRWLGSGFVDSFRLLHPTSQTYSWWSYRFRSRDKNIGWRIDYFIVARRISQRIADARIHTDIMGSDHCPVELDLE